MLGRGHIPRYCFGRRRHLGQIAHNQLLQPRLAEHRRHLWVERGEIERDDKIGAAVLDLVLKYLSGIERRVVDDSAAGLQHTEKRNNVVWCVWEVQANVDARLHAELLQSARRSVGKPAKFAVSKPPADEVDRGAIRPFGDGVI